MRNGIMHSASNRLFRHTYLAVLLASISLLIWAAGPKDSFAHPVFMDSSPEPFQSVPTSPTEVQVFFSEPIELGYSKISVLGPDASRVDRNDPHLVEGDTASIGVSMQPNLPEGVYTVTTRMLSAVDGHVVENTFTFGVGVATAPPTGGGAAADVLSLPESASRFPGMIGQVMVVGAAFASLWLWKPLSKIPWLSNAIASQRNSIDKGMMRLVVIGAGLVLASGAAMIIVQATSIGAGVTDAIATKFGNIWLARMLESAVLIAISIGVYGKVSKGKEHASRGELYAILVMGLAVTVTSSLIAHAAATNVPAAIAIDFFHHIAASIWIGGLIFLAFAAVPRLFKITDERTRAAAVSILIPRFSVVTVAILGIVVITGPLLLSIIESDLALTLSSVYGRVLAIKLALAGIMVGMGAYNQIIVQKKSSAILAGVSGGQSSVPRLNVGSFSKSLKAESAVGIALLIMVSLMTNSALPSGEFPSYRTEPSSVEAFAQEEMPDADFTYNAYTSQGRVEFSADPFAVGQNRFMVSFFDIEGNLVTNINSSTMKITQLERGIGPIAIEMQKNSNGTFFADAAFSLPGVWSIEIEGQRLILNASNMLASFDVTVKPLISNLDFAIKEYKTPESSLPLYPVYDAERQSIWFGDTFPESGRIWQFDIATENYTIHRIENASLITQILLDANGSIWYIDPTQSLLGFYDPHTSEQRVFRLPVLDVITGIAQDDNGNFWMPIVRNNQIVKYEPATGEFSQFPIPTEGSRPVGIVADNSGNIWFTQAVGNIARIDPATGNITEYAPTSTTRALDVPTAVFPDPKSSSIYISEHEGHTISVFDPILGLFRQYPVINEGGLPFGMAMDSYGNLWYAEHTIDRIAVLDPRTGQGTEAKIPTAGSFVQWITSDDLGRIWFAEQRGNGIGVITITAKPSAPSGNGTGGGTDDGGGPSGSPIVSLGFTLADIAGPMIAGGVILSALFYAKSATDLKRNVKLAQRLD